MFNNLPALERKLEYLDTTVSHQQSALESLTASVDTLREVTENILKMLSDSTEDISDQEQSNE